MHFSSASTTTEDEGKHWKMAAKIMQQQRRCCLMLQEECINSTSTNKLHASHRTLRNSLFGGEKRNFSTLKVHELVQLFPELASCKKSEEREKLYRKFHYLQMLQGNYEFSPEFSRQFTIGDLLGDGTFGFVALARCKNEKEKEKENFDDLQHQEKVSVDLQQQQEKKREFAVKFISKNSLPLQCLRPDDGIPTEIWILSKCCHPGIVKYFGHFEDENYYYLVTEVHGTEWNPLGNEKIGHLEGIGGCYDENKIPEHCNNGYNSPEHCNYEYNIPEHSPPSSFFSSPPSQDIHLKKLIQLTDLMARKSPIIKRAPMDLFECIEAHKFMPKRIIKSIIWQLVDILTYLEGNGIVHGDVKDENILIDHEYRIKLADFGSAFVLQSSATHDGGKTKCEKFFGTLQFAPPEVLNGKGYFGSASDVWSVGALLFVMITGMNYVETVEEGEGRKYRMLSLENCPSIRQDNELYALLMGLLQENFQKRFTLQQAKAHYWFSTA